MSAPKRLLPPFRHSIIIITKKGQKCPFFYNKTKITVIKLLLLRYRLPLENKVAAAQKTYDAPYRGNKKKDISHGAVTVKQVGYNADEDAE